MRYPRGGGLTAERQLFREESRLKAADRFAQGEASSVIGSASGRCSGGGDCGTRAVRGQVTDARADRVRLGPGTLPPPSLDGDSGRSLILVEALSTHWETVTHAPYTKTVGCEVALS